VDEDDVTNDQRAEVVQFAEALERGRGLHVEADDCPVLAGALRSLLEAADGAEVEAWETAQGIADSFEQAVATGAGLGISDERRAPIAAAIRELLDPEDIVKVWAKRDDA